jgi:hypothetical protein
MSAWLSPIWMVRGQRLRHLWRQLVAGCSFETENTKDSSSPRNCDKVVSARANE